MNTPAEITKYILGLDSLGNAGLLGWITSELSHDPKMAALVREYRETIDAKSLSSTPPRLGGGQVKQCHAVRGVQNRSEAGLVENMGVIA